MDDPEDNNVDMAELEAHLYAQIHHDAPETVEQFTADAKIQQQQQHLVSVLVPNRLVTSTTVVNNNVATVGGGPKKGRYWDNGFSGNAQKPKPPQLAFVGYPQPANTLNNKSMTAPSAAVLSKQQTTQPPDYRPKPFTPYTSYLSQMSSTPIDLPSTTTLGNSTPGPIESQPQNSLNFIELRAALKKKNKQNKKRAHPMKRNPHEPDRRPNPFNRLAEQKKQNVQKFRSKKEKALMTVTKVQSQRKIEIIDLDSDSNGNGDDDVICIPVPPPPLVCIDSSEDEEKPDESSNVENPDTDVGNIPEDFIGQKDRNRLSENDAFGGLDDDELAYISATAEEAVNTSTLLGKDKSLAIDCGGQVQSTNTDNISGVNPNSSTTTDNSTVDNASFATPKRSTLNTTYEVSENGFAAVDVYESESSDFPESIYEHGRLKQTPTNDLFDSDVSDIELNIQNRLKRRSKRRSTSSNKGSDYKTCSEEEDDDNSEDDIQPAFIDSIQATSTPCVQRGAAVATSKSKLVRPPNLSTKRNKRKSITEHSSDEEFVSMLSCIVHDNKHGDSSPEQLSQDLIKARSIVEQTLKKNSDTKNSSEPIGKNVSDWVVTDEVTGDSDTQTNDAPLGPNEGLVVMDSIGETDPIPNIVKEICEEDEKLEANVKGNAIESNDDEKCVPSCSLIADNPELCWNDEVRCFYKKSWGGENHNQAAIYKSLPKNRSEWKIVDEDLFPSTPQTSKRFNARNIRCNNCREKGHRLADCSQPPKPIQCHMCGETGHREPRCPHTICLRCGNKTHVFTRGCPRCLPICNMQCFQCKAKGHTARDCPDKWRRYHSTTKPNMSPQILPSIKKPKYCCVCASAGHLGEYCRNALRIMDNPAQPLKIQSYDETYQRLPEDQIKSDGNQLDHVAPFAFMTIPQEHYAFKWDVNEHPDRLYGRFMKATNVQRIRLKPISKKRTLSLSDKEQRKTKTRRKSKDNEATHKHLVLNPLNAIKNNITKEDKNMKGDVCKPELNIQDESELVIGSDVKVSPGIVDTNDTIITADTSGDMPEPSTTSSASCSDDVSNTVPITNKITNNIDDAFAHALDIDAIDEAVRLHEQSLLHDESLKPDVGKDQPTPKSNTSTVLTNFSFLSALSEVQQSSILKPTETHDTITTEIVEPLIDSMRNQTVQSDISFVTASDETLKCDQTIVDTDIVMEQLEAPPPPNISNTSITKSESLEMCAEIERLDKQEQILNNLKESLKLKKSVKYVSERVAEIAEDAVGYHVVLNEDIEKAAEEQKNKPEYDSDSNYSFSDYFTKQQDRLSEDSKSIHAHSNKVSLEDSVPMPDFIPLEEENDDDSDSDSNIVESNAFEERRLTPSLCVPERGPYIPLTNDLSQYSEAKIYLTKDHSKYLLTKSGGAFLTDSFTKHKVIVRMEWRNIGNILIVQGMQSAQDRFHADLVAYCSSAEEKIRKKQEISQQVPKNRNTLIRFIKEQLSQLDKQLGNVKDCFMRMKISEQQRSKTGTKNADKARRTLNMILLGQTGLRDGAMHLTALQSNLRCLIENETKDVISPAFRNEVFQHFKYIFSSYAHDDYADLVAQYEKIRKSKQLPVVRLDRTLLGIKIDVNKTVADASVSKEASAVPKKISSTATKEIFSDASDKPPSHVDSAISMNFASSTQNSATKSILCKNSDPFAQNLVQTNPKSSVMNELVTSASTPTKSDEQSQDTNQINISNIETTTTTKNNTPYVRGPDTKPSKIWSMKCLVYIEKCKTIPKISSNEKAMEKLRHVEVKAKNGAMSFNDFCMLMRIFDKCK